VVTSEAFEAVIQAIVGSLSPAATDGTETAHDGNPAAPHGMWGRSTNKKPRVSGAFVESG
jgi:hypothetical protein